MRRIKNNQIQTANPSILFARGVESLVSQHLEHPTYKTQDEAQKKQRVAIKQEPRGNLFNLLMRQFANNH